MKLARYEAPYDEDASAQRAWKQYIKQLTELLAADHRGDAVALFMKYVGMPDEQVEGVRQALFGTNFPQLSTPLWQNSFRHFCTTPSV